MRAVRTEALRRLLMTEVAQEAVFWTDGSSVCAPMAHGEDIAAHFHDYGQLRYAASTTTKVGTWVAPANRITWVPPFYVHSGRSYGETYIHVIPVPATVSKELPSEPTGTAPRNTAGRRRRRWPATPTPQPRSWSSTSL